MQQYTPKPHFSPSQFSTAGRCLRRWHFESVQGRRSPETSQMQRGTRIHKMLEVYVTDPSHPLPTQQKTVTYEEQLPIVLLGADGKRQTSEVKTVPCDPMEQRKAESALHYVPDPTVHTVVSEGEFLLAAEHTGLGKPVKGFIDLWVPGEKRISDYKTRGSDKYDKDEEELRHDPQCILYAKEKLLKIQPDADGKRRVNFRHINIYMDGKRTRPVDLDGITEEEVEAGLQRLRPIAQRMLIAEKLQVEEVPVNLHACGDYRGCTFRVECARLGLPVYGDNYQARMAREMAKAEGKYKSPEELEEQMAGFASAVAKTAPIVVNPPDGVPAGVIGAPAVHEETVKASLDASSELDEEGQGEAPTEAMLKTPEPVAELEPETTVGRKSVKDNLVQEILQLAKTFSSSSQLDTFAQMTGERTQDPTQLKRNLLTKSVATLRELLVSTRDIASAPEPKATKHTETELDISVLSAPMPTSLADVAAYEASIREVLTALPGIISAADKVIADAKKARSDAEDAGDDLQVAAVSSAILARSKARKATVEAYEQAKNTFTDEFFAKLTKDLTPVPQAPAVAQTPAPAAAVQTEAPVKNVGTGKPMLLVRAHLIADNTNVLHVEALVSKYQRAVAAAASVSSYHEIKFEGAIRVAGLFAKDLESGQVDITKYTAVIVPRRGSSWDPIIDVLRPFVSLIVEGVG